MSDRIFPFEGALTSVTGTDWVVVCTMALDRGYGGGLAFEVYNAGDAALADLELQLQDHVNGEWYSYLTGADWARTDLVRLVFATAGLATLGAASKGHAQVDMPACRAFRFRAKRASGTISVQVRGTQKG